MDFFQNINSSQIQNAIVRVLIIFIILLVLVLLVRLFFNLTLFFLIRKYKGYKEKKKLRLEKKDTTSTLKEDEELHRDKEKESELVGVERIPAKYDRESEFIDNLEPEEGKIVGVAEPIGFWTSLILGQKLTFLVNQAHVLNQKEKKGFWVALVEAQGRSRDRQRARGGR